MRPRVLLSLLAPVTFLAAAVLAALASYGASIAIDSLAGASHLDLPAAVFSTTFGGVAFAVAALATRWELRWERLVRPTALDHIRHMWPFYVFLAFAWPIPNCTMDTCDFYFVSIAPVPTTVGTILANAAMIIWCRRVTPPGAVEA